MLKLLRFALAAACLFAAGPVQAAFQATPHDAAGFFTTTPWLATNGRVTITTVTNGAATWVPVHVTVLDANWQPLDFDCWLSPMETTYFVFEANVVGSKVTSECSDRTSSNLNIVQTRFIPGEQQGFTVFRENAVNSVSGLIADFTVIDFSQGYAFSANGWHYGRSLGIFQLPGGLLSQNTNFLGPRTLATGFIAPDDDVTAELLLYTLHGRAGWPSPVKFGGLAYDDDEQPLSNTHEYDCFTIVSLEDIFGLSIRRENGPGGFPYFVGHVSLFSLSHPNGLRFTSYPTQFSTSIGYLIQTVGSGAALNGNQPLGAAHGNFGETMPSAGAWARKLLKTLDTARNVNCLDPTADVGCTPVP